MRARKLAALFLLVAVPAGAAQSIPEALERIAAAGNPGDRFTFVVLGDTRHYVPVAQPPAFKRAVAEINVLRPDFVIDIGDLILGYTNNMTLLQREWDEYFKVIDGCTVPWLSVVGNHDVSNPVHERVWKERLGPLRYSFTYGGCLFVCLNSEEQGWVDKISPAQARWVAKVLSANRSARCVFVFLHRPVFDDKQGADSWQAVHKALAAHPAPTKIVFAGHRHIYRLLPQRDGVLYVITGGGGAEIGGIPQAGDFHHYLLATVRGGSVYWAVIKPGSVLPPDAVTSADAAEISAKAKVPGKPVASLAPDGRSCTIRLPLANSTGAPVTASVTWEGLAYCAKITPGEVAAVVRPGQRKALTFTLTAPDIRAAVKTLVCVVTMSYRRGAATFSKRLSVRLQPTE